MLLWSEAYVVHYFLFLSKNLTSFDKEGFLRLRGRQTIVETRQSHQVLPGVSNCNGPMIHLVFSVPFLWSKMAYSEGLPRQFIVVKQGGRPSFSRTVWTLVSRALVRFILTMIRKELANLQATRTAQLEFDDQHRVDLLALASAESEGRRRVSVCGEKVRLCLGRK